MGMSTSAKLIYGYHLESQAEGWLVAEAHGPDSDDYGLNLPWLGEDSDDFQSKAEDRLREATGYEEGDYRADPDGWRARRREAAAKIGVKFEAGGYEFGDLFLAAVDYEADLGETKEIDPAAMLAAGAAEADEKLRAALAILGLTPTQEKPAWLLTACRG